MCGARDDCHRDPIECIRARRSSRRPRRCVGARRQTFQGVPACPVPWVDGKGRFARTTHNRHRASHDVRRCRSALRNLGRRVPLPTSHPVPSHRVWTAQRARSSERDVVRTLSRSGQRWSLRSYVAKYASLMTPTGTSGGSAPVFSGDPHAGNFDIPNSLTPCNLGERHFGALTNGIGRTFRRWRALEHSGRGVRAAAPNHAAWRSDQRRIRRIAGAGDHGRSGRAVLGAGRADLCAGSQRTA